MTDQEKIKRIVAWMGGWPEHRKYSESSGCVRCGTTYNTSECFHWNPFERIEDAMLVVERFRTVSADWGEDSFELHFSFNLRCIEFGNWEAVILIRRIEGEGRDFNPASAITDAAWQVIEKCNKK